MQLLALLVLAESAACLTLSSSLRTMRSAPAHLARCRHLAMSEGELVGKGGLPPGIADRLSFQTGGSKVARQEEEALILLNLVKDCYPSEERPWLQSTRTH